MISDEFGRAAGADLETGRGDGGLIPPYPSPIPFNVGFDLATC